MNNNENLLNTMGKSKAKTKAMKLGGRKQSDKKDKTIANKKFRRRTKTTIDSGREEDVPTKMREVSDTWDFSSDGLAYYDPDLPEKYMRK